MANIAIPVWDKPKIYMRRNAVKIENGIAKATIKEFLNPIPKNKVIITSIPPHMAF
jgi:hypothetical protein